MKTPPDEQVRAGEIARSAIQLGRKLVSSMRDGKQVDREIEQFIRDSGGEPALKGYRPPFSCKEYNWTICLAVDNDAVHGTPIKTVGPPHLVTIDLVVGYKGWYADTARTFTTGDDTIRLAFAEKSRAIFDVGLSCIAPMQLVNNFGMMVEEATKLAGYGIVKEFCGHGIGQAIHTDPQIVNYYTPSNIRFETGKSYAVEPVLAINDTYSLRKNPHDGWTVIADCLVSHNEDTIFVSNDGIFNLTGDI